MMKDKILEGIKVSRHQGLKIFEPRCLLFGFLLLTMAAGCGQGGTQSSQGLLEGTFTPTTTEEVAIANQITAYANSNKNEDYSALSALLSAGFLYSNNSKNKAAFLAEMQSNFTTYDAATFEVKVSNITVSGTSAAVTGVLSTVLVATATSELVITGKGNVTMGFAKEGATWEITSIDGGAGVYAKTDIYVPGATLLIGIATATDMDNPMTSANTSSVTLSGITISLGQIQSGIYGGIFNKPAAGTYTANINATSLTGASYQLTHTFVVR